MAFIETPFRMIDKKKGAVTDKVRYMTADQEEDLIVAQANEPLGDDGVFEHERVMCRVRDQIVEVSRNEVDLMDVSQSSLFRWRRRLFHSWKMTTQTVR